MSRDIDFSKALSPEDAQYVHDRPWLLADQELQGNVVEFEEDTFGLDEDADDAEDDGEEHVDYTALTVSDLKAEIARRNGDKGEDEEEIVAASDRKPDLVAALEADDAAENE